MYCQLNYENAVIPTAQLKAVITRKGFTYISQQINLEIPLNLKRILSGVTDTGRNSAAVQGGKDCEPLTA
jgi:hypothetical protein